MARFNGQRFGKLYENMVLQNALIIYTHPVLTKLHVTTQKAAIPTFTTVRTSKSIQDIG
jgi:hypothetical protein